MNIAPTWQQHLAWQALENDYTDDILFGGGAGGGKSHLGCEWEITQCLRYPGVRYFIGRDELKKIRQSTVITIYKVLQFHKIPPDAIFKFNGQDNCFKFRNGSQIDLLELKFKPADPMYERFGSLEYTGGWIEEGGEVEEDAAIMIGSRIGRHHNDKYKIPAKKLITCNPKKNWLYYNFYLPWKENRLVYDKAFIQALAIHNEYGESGYLKQLSKLGGAIGARLRDGNWEYDNDPACLIETDAIAKVFQSFIWPIEDVSQKFYLTCDVARHGKDCTVIGLWKGWNVKLFRYRGLDTVQTSQKIKEFAKLYGIPLTRIVVDADGVGGGVVDQLRCLSFINGSRPFPSPVNPARDEKNQPKPENYANLKAQCYYRAAEKVNLGVCKIQIEKTEAVPQIETERQLIRQEMEQVKRKKLDGDGKMDVIGREEIVQKFLGRSMDYWSAIMMRVYFDIVPIQSLWVL